MNYRVLDKIFHKSSNPRIFEYIEIDANFKIVDISQQAKRFADNPEYVSLGEDACLSFPELIGIEDILTGILTGQEDMFEIAGITRYSQGGGCLYIDLYIIGKHNEQQEDKFLVILLEDVTSKMILEQRLAQRVNEARLLSIKLKKAEQYIDKVINSMAESLVVTTVTGEIKKVNYAAQKLFGYAEKELINQSISLLITEANFLYQTRQQHPLFNNHLRDVEVHCLTKKREELLVAFSCSMVESESSESKDLVYVGRDVTARQRSQKRQAVQYAIARILSESATVNVAIPQILQAICEILDWDLGELWTPDEDKYQGHRGYSINPVLRCVEIWSRSSVVISEFKVITYQTTYTPGVGLPGSIWANHSPQWISHIRVCEQTGRSQTAVAYGFQTAFGFPILDDNDILGVMTFFSRTAQAADEELQQIMLAIGCQIAQFIKRKRAEVALSESEERYRDLFENANDLIQCISPSGRFIYVNRAWRKALGYTEAEITHLNAFDVIHPDFKGHCRNVFYQVLSGEKVGELKTAFITKNGESIFVEGNISCKFVDGKPVGTRGLFRNINHRLIAEEALRQQQKQTERLLLNILPTAIVNRLKQSQNTIAEDFADVTVLFADIVGFTQIANNLNAIQLVSLLNLIFSEFDRLTEQYGLEKIKTTGDAYMVVGGLPIRRGDHAQAIAQIALEMQTVIDRFNVKNLFGINGCSPLQLRIGIHTGPVVAGVIGLKKFSYDLWGDTVNIASRMESQGVPGKIQVTSATYQRLRNEYLFTPRGDIEVKGKGYMTTYFLLGRMGVDTPPTD